MGSFRKDDFVRFFCGVKLQAKYLFFLMWKFKAEL